MLFFSTSPLLSPFSPSYILLSSFSLLSNATVLFSIPFFFLMHFCSFFLNFFFTLSNFSLIFFFCSLSLFFISTFSSSIALYYSFTFLTSSIFLFFYLLIPSSYPQLPLPYLLLSLIAVFLLPLNTFSFFTSPYYHVFFLKKSFIHFIFPDLLFTFLSTMYLTYSVLLFHLRHLSPFFLINTLFSSYFSTFFA